MHNTNVSKVSELSILFMACYVSVMQQKGSTSSYSVMQSDGNSFSGDVVLNSFNIVYSDEDGI